MGAAAPELENSKCFCCCHLLYYISKSKVYNRRALIRGSVDQSRKKWASENVTFSGCRFSHCDVAGVIFGQFSPIEAKKIMARLSSSLASSARKKQLVQQQQTAVAKLKMTF